ncbi:arg8-vasotocin receptor-like [Conger conger]|uniref:arg8-vasotocin receptor-like n=1 Tax=Conger conger TaxID=82655 RepID=UPI002A598A56|nr:arg8-vasotocin receptor-like [Conger conger]
MLNCSNRSTEPKQCENLGWEDKEEHVAFVKVGVLGFIFVFAACGNLILLYALWRKRKRNSRTHLFLLHLCFADLVVAFFQVLPQLSMEITYRFKGTDVACRAVKYLQVVGMFASTYMIVVMTVDRYNAVCRPMVSFFRGSFRRYISIGAAWLISLAFSTPQLFIFSLQEVDEHEYDCWATFIEPWGSKIYITWITLAVFVLPAIILIFCQIKICSGIYFNMKRKALQSTNNTRVLNKGVSSSMLKTVKMTFVIILVYTMCWSPFFVVQLWSAWSPRTAPTDGPTFVIIMLLASLNSCTNPWIYLSLTSSISKQVKLASLDFTAGRWCLQNEVIF